MSVQQCLHIAIVSFVFLSLPIYSGIWSDRSDQATISYILSSDDICMKKNDKYVQINSKSHKEILQSHTSQQQYGI